MQIATIRTNSHQRCSIKKGVLRNFAKYTRKHVRQSLFNLSKKETMVQVLSCEFWEIFNNSFFTEHLRATASGFGKPCLNSDLYFYIQNLWYSFIRDNSFLQTPSQSLTGKQNSSLSTSRHINNITALMCIFFSFLSFSCANQNNSIING